MRTITIEPRFTRHAEGSVLIGFGDTKVLVTASVEEKVPPFLRGKGEGWVTAEYGMLPRATHTRGQREAAKGKQIGPHPGNPAADRPLALRAVTDLKLLGERQISARLRRDPGGWRHAHRLDLGRVGRAAPRDRQSCSAGQADGRSARRQKVAAISCGIYQGHAGARPRL